MIQSLHISNYALIDEVELDLSEGLNIITGETGAGKSIMLGALSLLLGGRADTRVVTDPERKSVIEATFNVEAYPRLRTFCADADIEWSDDGLAILRREISPNGRSRAFINDSPVNLTQLRSVAMQLVDLHSQHQNMLLADPSFQLRIIDSLADNGKLLQEYEGRYNAYRHAARAYHKAKRDIEQTRADEEFMRFRLAQLDDLQLTDGEEEQLEHDREIQANLTEIKSNLDTITEALHSGSSNAGSLLRTASEAASDLADLSDEAADLAERLETVRIELNDIAESYLAIDHDLNADPEELERIDSRLAAIADAKRRNQADSIEQLIDMRENLRVRLDSIDNADETMAQLEREAKRARHAALELARTISGRRHAQAEEFAALLKERAVPLGMKNLNPVIDVSQSDMSATGIDAVEFRFAFNKNQTPLPVGNTASGGEISRLMLSIKSIIADKMQLPSIIFDEVDTGVSGDVANRMGEMMRAIAGNIQVVAITHLPQVAAKGVSHYKVYKEDDEKSTHTRLRRLSDEERVDELALMLSGSAIDEAARANARSLLNQKKN